MATEDVFVEQCCHVFCNLCSTSGFRPRMVCCGYAEDGCKLSQQLIRPRPSFGRFFLSHRWRSKIFGLLVFWCEEIV